MPKSIINVLVVDDHDLVRIGITRMLSSLSGIRVVGQASSGEEAVKLARKLTPDVVLMDVRMPVMDGLEATSKLLRVCPDSHVLVVTSCDEEPYPSRLLEAGAAGYLTKGASLEEMEQAIRMVTAGQRYIKSEIAQQMALKPFTQTTTANPFDSLSNREYQIAKMRADGKEVTEISDRLHLSPKTVNSYRYRIQEKLAVRNDQEVTRLAIKYGVIDLDIVKNNSASEEIATAD